MLDALGSLAPPPRFAQARFDVYRAGSSGQREALGAARAFAERVAAPPSVGERVRAWWPGATPEAPRGLYLVGPAGTGKTHLMAAVFHRLTPDVPCAFLHSSRFFRTAAPPKELAEALSERGPDGMDGCRALMLDEVELDDAANEARLAHFLGALARRGVALLATSNARPDEFLSRHHAGGGAHQRFLADALAGRSDTVLVHGTDRRRQKGGVARAGLIFVGPPEATRTALREAFEEAEAPKRWLPFDELRRAATETAHARLLTDLLQADRLYVPDVQIAGTDDALRLLRLVDDLYTEPSAPALFFSARGAPEDWFSASGRKGIEAGVAEKFARTASRLRELCAVQDVEKEAPEAA